MFRPTSDQQSLLGAGYLLGPDKLERLKKTWAHQWRCEILPLIDEEPFAQFFSGGMGAPNKSIRQVVSLLVFKHLFGLTDRQLVEQFQFNLLWHYALDVDPLKANIERKTLSTYRGYLMELGGAAALFRQITDHLVDLEGLEVDVQRLDSTHVLSDMRDLSRLGLFCETIAAFMRQLRKLPAHFDRLDQPLVDRYLDRQGSFGDPAKDQARRQLVQAAEDAVFMARAFKGDEEVEALEHWTSLCRLVDEHCRIEGDDDDDGRPVVGLIAPAELDGSRMESPHDHDAGHGHKGTGYSVQLSETCHPDNPFEMVTDVEVAPANRKDDQRVGDALDRLEAAGRRPETLLADAGYISADTIVDAEQRGVDLVGPLAQGTPPDEETWHVSDFELDDERVPLRCPMGHRRTRVDRGKKRTLLVRFDQRICRHCEHRHKCPVMRVKVKRAQKKGKKVRLRKDPALRVDPRDLVIAKRRQRQKTEAFKTVYRRRCGVEARNSVLKETYGMRRLKRSRGMGQVDHAVHLKVLACNIAGWLSYRLQGPKSAAAAARVAILALHAIEKAIHRALDRLERHFIEQKPCQLSQAAG